MVVIRKVVEIVEIVVDLVVKKRPFGHELVKKCCQNCHEFVLS